MGTHLIPRSDVKGQDRFFIIFSVPGLIGTLIGLGLGYLIYAIMSLVGLNVVGLIAMAIFGVIGFAIGQVKIPDTNAFPIFKKIGGEYIKDIILRYIKFQREKKKYVNDVSSKQNFEIKESKIDKIVMNKE